MEKEITSISLEDLIEKTLGPIGTPSRDKHKKQLAKAIKKEKAVNYHDELVSLLQRFVNESMLSYTGDEMARELLSKIPQ